MRLVSFVSLFTYTITVMVVSELMGWVRSVVLMNVYLGLENPGGVGILGRGSK
jgi:hypothetical protein